jgi:hypothetical protein
MMLTKTGMKPLFDRRRIFSALDTPPCSRSLRRTSSSTQRSRWGPIRRNTFVIEDSVHGVHGARWRPACGSSASPARRTAIPGHADALTEAGAETVIRRWADFLANGVMFAASNWTEWSAETIGVD